MAAIQVLRGSLKPVVSSQHFYFFRSPTVIMPSQFVLLRAFSPINRWIYKKFVEPQYTYSGFMNGAIQAIMVAALHLRERKLDKFRKISTEKTTEYFKRRLPELPQDLLDQKLTFERHQFVNGFIHGSFFSMNNIVEAALSNNNDSLIYHATFAFFIDQSAHHQKKPIVETNTTFSDEEELLEKQRVEEERVWEKFPPDSAPTINQLLNSKSNNDMLVCNITLSRQVGAKSLDDYGRWRITDLNFFDIQFALNLLHTY